VARLLRDVGEHAWIGRVVRRLAAAPAARRVAIGPGDDAAVIRPGRGALLLTTDALLEGVHFRAGWASPAMLGRRAFAINASDLAAMGGEPTFALLALEAPATLPAADLDALVTGFARAARDAGACLVGGNLARGPHLAITATLLGEARGPIVGRDGARAGDALYVTGTLGRTGLAVRRLRAGRRVPWPMPPLRLRAGRLLAPLAHAMIDVSDGLVHRYPPHPRIDGLPGEEGTFNMCSFWLVEALTRAGQAYPEKLDQARLLFERVLGYANHLGLYAEQTGPQGEALGNFPQAFTHLALISAAFNLDRMLGSQV